MFFQIYGETAGWQLLGWLLVFAGLVIMNEIARRSKWGGIACFLVLPAVLSVYFIAIYIGAASGAEWALNNDTYVHMNSWFHYAKLYAATAGCIGFMILKYHLILNPRSAQVLWQAAGGCHRKAYGCTAAGGMY